MSVSDGLRVRADEITTNTPVLCIRNQETESIICGVVLLLDGLSVVH